MKRAALGIRMHSGWGVLVAVGDAIDIIDRRRIVVTDDNGPRGNQPFHCAQELGLLEAEEYLSKYRTKSERLAQEEIGVAVKKLNGQGYDVAVAALLLASGRPLPVLSKILASHPLIHAAEGELFREVVNDACKSLKVPVVRYRERDLEELGKVSLTCSMRTAKERVASGGKAVGPPWTADHKAAALAAYLALRMIGKDKSPQQ